MVFSTDDLMSALRDYAPEMVASGGMEILICGVVLLDPMNPVCMTGAANIGPAARMPAVWPLNQEMTLICTDGPFPWTPQTPTPGITAVALSGSPEPEVVYRTLINLFNSRLVIESAEKKLIRALLSGASLQQFAEIGADIFGNPVHIIGRNMKPIATSRCIQSDDPLLPQGTYNETIKELLKTISMDELYAAKEGRTLTLPFARCRYFGKRIEVGKNIVGHIAISDSNQPFRKIDSDLVQMFAQYVGCAIKQLNAVGDQARTVFEQFVLELLADATPDKGLLTLKAEYLQINVEPNLYVMLIQGNASDYSYFSMQLEKLLPGSTAFSSGDGIIVTAGKKEVPYPPDELEGLEMFLRTNNMIAGLSRPFRDMIDFRQHYLQAKWALTYGGEHRERQSLFRYDEFAMQHILDMANRQGEIKPVILPVLLDILDYDLKYNKDFSITLYTYLYYNCDLVKTAKSFDIHKNSMYYRIDRIQDLFKINLNDLNTVHLLMLSYQILLFVADENSLPPSLRQPAPDVWR